ncbi:MAG TPA: glycosyltransferase family 4 protein [Candidatus Polarisedimenticolia bacterium]|nr:glycosyltransferase family 4 protein [Candidatus Polarisedimenticolia bacterium]
MRLAVVSPFVDRRHGTERALAELLERLASKEHCEIHLYAQRVDDLVVNQAGVPRSQESGAIFWHKIPSVPGPHLLRFLAWLFLNSVSRTWGRWFQGLRFDLVVSPGINCLDADVIIVHALFHRLQELASEAVRDSAKPGFLRRLHRRAYYSLLARLERRTYTNPAVSLVAVSQRTAALLNDYFHRQDARVIPNGVDTAQFSPPARLALRAGARLRRKIPESDFVLLLIGNDWRVKGLETVLRGVGALRELPILVIAAGDDSPDFFHETANALGISDRCRFEPSREDVLDFYAAADLYVSPSREDSFALPVAEAMACGVPVITSTNAGVADMIHDGINGFILRQFDDFQALARLVGQLHADEVLRGNVGAAAAKTALQWTWDRNAAEAWELLKDAARKKALASVRKP